MSISSALALVRLPNLPLHLWNIPSLTSIGNAIGKFYFQYSDTNVFSRHHMLEYARRWIIIMVFPLK